MGQVLGFRIDIMTERQEADATPVLAETRDLEHFNLHSPVYGTPGDPRKLKLAEPVS